MKKLSTIMKHKANQPDDSTLNDFEKYAENNEINWDEFLTGDTHWFYLYRMVKKQYGLDALMKYDAVDYVLHLHDFENTITRVICEYENINYETLKTYKNKYDTKRLLPEYVTALNLKLAGLKDQTALTKTMTVEQLFMTGNPMWTRPYSLNQIVRLNELAEKVGHENMNVIAQYFKITPNWKDEITDKIWELA